LLIQKTLAPFELSKVMYIVNDVNLPNLISTKHNKENNVNNEQIFLLKVSQMPFAVNYIFTCVAFR
jgi:hypothetical protein